MAARRRRHQPVDRSVYVALLASEQELDDYHRIWHPDAEFMRSCLLSDLKAGRPVVVYGWQLPGWFLRAWRGDVNSRVRVDPDGTVYWGDWR
jgi:hypothetical protein